MKRLERRTPSQRQVAAFERQVRADVRQEIAAQEVRQRMRDAMTAPSAGPAPRVDALMRPDDVTVEESVVLDHGRVPLAEFEDESAFVIQVGQ
jgi:hypothetical protein